MSEEKEKNGAQQKELIDKSRESNTKAAVEIPHYKIIASSTNYR